MSRTGNGDRFSVADIGAANEVKTLVEILAAEWQVATKGIDFGIAPSTLQPDSETAVEYIPELLARFKKSGGVFLP